MKEAANRGGLVRFRPLWKRSRVDMCVLVADHFVIQRDSNHVCHLDNGNSEGAVHGVQLVVGHFIDGQFADFVVQIGHGISLLSRDGIIPAIRVVENGNLWSDTL